MLLSNVSFVERDEAIARSHNHEEVVLWFEHDLYDQLQLIQILDWFSHQDLGHTRLSLIPACGVVNPNSLRRLTTVNNLPHTS